ncbi:MAG: alpha/beta hydrolase [Lachnospiraceae bacterium]|nr:alpha/beta hydrolase [Lachnospiraceae bacterium]
MRKEIKVEAKQEALTLLTDVAYAHVDYWFDGATYRDMKMSLIFPKIRTKEMKRPVILWLCGGGFLTMECNVWLPQLVHLAERGYIIASPQYRTVNEGMHPCAIQDIKASIRFLRAHADCYGVDPDHIFIMGESAGATLAILTSVTSGEREFEVGEYLDYSSDVQGVVDFYGISDVKSIYEGAKDVPPRTLMKITAPFFEGVEVETSAITKVTENTPPTLILHGAEDALAPISQSVRYYETLEKAGVETDLYIFEGAGHGDARFYQEEVYEIIDNFLQGLVKA